MRRLGRCSNRELRIPARFNFHFRSRRRLAVVRVALSARARISGTTHIFKMVRSASISFFFLYYSLFSRSRLQLFLSLLDNRVQTLTFSHLFRIHSRQLLRNPNCQGRQWLCTLRSRRRALHPRRRGVSVQEARRDLHTSSARRREIRHALSYPIRATRV